MARAPRTPPRPQEAPRRFPSTVGFLWGRGGRGGGARAHTSTPFHGSLGFRLHKLFLFDKASTISCSRGRCRCGGARAPPPAPPTAHGIVKLTAYAMGPGGWKGGARAPYPPFIPSPDAHILFLLFDWEKDASGRYEHKTLINLMKSSSPWLLPGG